MPEIKSVSRGRTLWRECEVADTAWKRFSGIMLRKRLDAPLLFVLPREGRMRAAIHSLFCIRFDAVFLDSGKAVVDLREDVHPWKFVIIPKRPAKYLIECAAGEAQKLGITEGERLEF
ncbi:MAG: DUF192 domain-containing protein [Candidatus Micrarchaeota archaeon]